MELTLEEIRYIKSLIRKDVNNTELSDIKFRFKKNTLERFDSENKKFISSIPALPDFPDSPPVSQ